MLKTYFLALPLALLLVATLSAQVQAGSVGIGPTARPTAAGCTDGQLRGHGVIMASSLNTTSDRRLQHVPGLSDRAGLTLLRRVRITDYIYIDQHAHTDELVEIIAQ